MTRNTLGWMGLSVLSALFVGACDAADPEIPGDQTAAPEPTSDDANGEAEEALSAEDVVRLPRCGGFAGFPCPDGSRCVDLPGDGCDPRRGGADCIGVCRRSPQRAHCNDPSRRYVGHSPEMCSRIRYFCAAGRPFSDECGCGCIEARRPDNRVKCGRNVCGPNQYCCNASCGICAPRGGACIQIACEDNAVLEE